MKCVVGRVIKDVTDQGINPNTSVKYHFCVCSINRYFLFINSRKFEQDFPLTRSDCPGMPNDISHISVWRVLQVPTFTKRVKLIGAVSGEFLERLADHVRSCTVAREREKRQIIEGIERHLNDKNA
jgi:hypothetical protein